MPQETNLNVAPYFDDFDQQSNYYKVLFKPAYPVQARELNNLQSILQNQVEDMGTHFFKEGAKVIPGQTSYLSNYYAIQIEPEYLGVPVSLYLDQLVGKLVVGQQSGVSGKVSSYITNEQSERGNYTLYIDYLASSSTDSKTQTFFDDEILLTTENITFATTFIGANEGFAKALTTNASAIGSAFALSNGVYFLRGHFVDVFDQILLLDQYSNTPSYRIGLKINERIVSSDEDSTLTDNAQGFNNYTAPGADRLEISATLFKKASDDYSDQNFVQISEVQNGLLRGGQAGADYNILGDELARRTFDESGHYYVSDFLTTVHNSLNNGIGNRGIYKSGQVTSQGNTPSDDIGIYKVSPGKAYVRGYEVEVRGPSFLDFEKPRTTKLKESSSVQFSFGPSFLVNRAFGSPALGFDTENVISLRDTRVGDNPANIPGKEIGIARFYDASLESGAYDNVYPDINKWDVSLFDLQTYTELDLNEAATLTTPTFIEGKSSGATAYLRHSISAGTALTAYCVQGDFFTGEKLEFNGVSDNSRSTVGVLNFEISDVQSLYTPVGAAGTYTADIIPQVTEVIGIASITAHHSGISTINSPGTAWPGIVTTGNLVQFSIATNDFPNLARVTQVNTNSIQVSGVTTITSYREGGLPTTLTTVSDFSVVKSSLQKTSGGNAAGNESLYSVMPHFNIESTNLDNANLIIRKGFSVNITNNSTGTIAAGADEVFLPFDEERYTLIRSDGSIEVLTKDRFVFSSGLTQLTINGLGSNNTGAQLTATVRKSKIKAKIKSKKEAQSVVISRSRQIGSGTNVNSRNDGLTYGNFPFGTRVQDSIISLGIPDVIFLYGLFESLDENDPEAPSMTTASLDGPNNTTNDLIIGEEVVGTISGARAKYVTKKTDTSINFIYENDSKFENGEIVRFETSGVSAIVSDLQLNGSNITKNFKLLGGQRKTIYDVARLVRKDSAPVPTRKLRAYYLSAEYDPSDTGDITVANSYKSFKYDSEIGTIQGSRLSDIIDARPRVSKNFASAGSRSPLEFFGRSFNGGQHSSANVIASDESMSLDYNYYLPRIDRIYLSKDGVLSVKKGAPADNPAPPDEVSSAMNIATVFLPAYLYGPKGAKVTFIKHKRYQMSDISKIEQRVKHLEYYTSLNQLESATVNQFVPDANGLNRFKSGVFIDNFTTLESQDTSVGVRNSIDTRNKALRPAHYTTALELVIGNNTIAGIGEDSTNQEDSRYADILGTNVKRSGQMVTLDYVEERWLRNPFATRVESVTPFLVRFWEGSLRFEPDVDVWVDVNRMEERDVLQEGSFTGVAEALGAEVTEAADGTRSGLSPVIWQSWETTGVNVSFSLDSSSEENAPTTQFRKGTATEFVQMYGVASRGRSMEQNLKKLHNKHDGQVPPNFEVEEESTTTDTTVSGTVGVQLDQQRKGKQHTVSEQIDTESLGDRIVSRNVIQFMRARNIEFTATRLKPFTQMYPFFDNVDVASFCTPKLIEIEMVSGTFEIGEDITGTMPSDEDTDTEDVSTAAFLDARVAVPNHKYGPYNGESDDDDASDDLYDIFEINPYDREGANIPETYSETSTILNIDTFSLANSTDTKYSGYIATNMILRGSTSNAEAKVTNVRLIGDRLGTLIGNFRVPNGAESGNPVFETGRSRLRLTSSSIDSRIPGVATSAAEEIFFSQGDSDNTQEVTLSLRNARVETDDTFSETRSLDDEASASTTFQTGSTAGNGRLTGIYSDPLAQSFAVDDPTGIYLTSMDIFFERVPDNDEAGPVTVQIREVELGQPSSKILAYSEVSKDPSDITVSSDCSVATKFTFESPVYLNGQKEYAMIILSNSTDYTVWISRLGETDVSTLDGTEEGQYLVSSQELLGSLYKSQNASVWTPSQYEDLTFDLFRANFVPNGSVQFFNPPASEDESVMKTNPLTMSSNTIRVGLGTTVIDTGIADGNLITQVGTNASGRFVGLAGSVTSTLTITNVGAGFTPSSGNHYTFTGVALTSLTGNGINATADITIQNGVAIGATIVNGGKGYALGDILEPISIGNLSLGEGMKLSVNDIYGENELVIEGVQGTFSTGASNTLLYTNNSGLTTALNHPGPIAPLSPIREVSDGLHFKVFHRNHGMYATGNVVTLSGLSTKTRATTLTVDYSTTATTDISIASSITPTNFGEFEGIGVGATNPGYVKIGSEVIAYTGVAGDTLTGITRGIDNTQSTSHTVNNVVYKYELNGVSLRRINRTHNLNDITNNERTTLDTYDLKIDMSDTSVGIDRSGTTAKKLFFNETTEGGGPNGKATFNVPYTMIVPKINTTEPTGTTISPSVRTTSGTSASGVEPSFIDDGFEEVANMQENYFESPKIVASKVNEDLYLSELPGNKSFTMNMDLVTEDSRITPCIDLNQLSIVFTGNRIDEPITDYSTDPRVNTTKNDPNRFFYVTKNVVLENPASALQVFLDGYVPQSADLRCFYSLNQDGPVDDTIFIPFPGFGNFNPNGTVQSQGSSNGSPDSNVPKVDVINPRPTLGDYREYKFSVDQLPSFKSFRIKVIGTSTNQATVPMIRNFRAISLA